MAQLYAEGTRALGQQRLVVPAYFHPALRPDYWESLAEHAPQVRLVILNLADGPGLRPDTAFDPALERLRDAGVAVAGYVDTNYGRRPAPEILADLGRYLEWYGVGGVCFDRAAAAVEHLGHYATLASRAREAGAAVVLFNHGTHPVEAYAEHADVLGTFEGPILGAILLFAIQTIFTQGGPWYLVGLGATAALFALAVPCAGSAAV